MEYLFIFYYVCGNFTNSHLQCIFKSFDFKNIDDFWNISETLFFIVSGEILQANYTP